MPITVSDLHLKQHLYELCRWVLFAEFAVLFGVSEWVLCGGGG